MVKILQDKQVINKSVYIAPNVNTRGPKELFGMWLSETEGAELFNVPTEFQNRGVKDILFVCIGGLKSFPDAIFPETQIQLCIVHMVKHVPFKDYKAVTTDLKNIYQSITEDEALLVLEQFSN